MNLGVTKMFQVGGIFRPPTLEKSKSADSLGYLALALRFRLSLVFFLNLRL
jgi:hypothetical protein